MKIAFLAPRFHSNQIGLVHELRAAGHAVAFGAAWRGANEEHTEVAPHVFPQAIFSRMLTFLFQRLGRPLDPLLFFAPSPFAVFYWLRAERPEVLIVRGFLEPLPLTGLLFARLLGIRVMLYTQGPVFRTHIDVPHRILYFLAFRVLRLPWITPVLFRVTEGTPEVLHHVHGLSWVPFCAPPPAPGPPAPSANLHVLTVAKFEPRKRLIELIEGMGALPEKARERFRVTLVGNADLPHQRAYLAKVRARITTLGLEDRVEIFLDLSRSDTLAKMSKSDIFVMNSSGEPASVSQLEAMSRGLAVLCTMDNGTAHYVENGRNGLWLDYAPETLERALLFLLANPSELARWKQASLEIVQEKFTGERVCERLFAALTD